MVRFPTLIKNCSYPKILRVSQTLPFTHRSPSQMASSRRILSSILRPSSRRSASKSPISNANPTLSTPSAYGYLLNRTSEYATAAKPPPPSESPTTSDGSKVIVDEVPGRGSTGQVCLLLGSNIVDVMFEEGLPPISTVLQVLDNSTPAYLQVVEHLRESIVRTCSVGCTEGFAIGQRVLNTGFPIYQPIWMNPEESAEQSCSSDDDGDDDDDDDDDRCWDDVEREPGPDLNLVCEKLQKCLLERQLLEKKVPTVPRPKPEVSASVRYGSIGTVCRRLKGGSVVDIIFDKKFEIGTNLEVLPATLEVFPKHPMVLHVCPPIFNEPDLDDEMVRAIPLVRTDTVELFVGMRVFGFPIYRYDDELGEALEDCVDSLQVEVASLQEKLRLMK